MTDALEESAGKKKRPSARPLYKDIYNQFIGDSDLLGIYSFILGQVAWGDHNVSLRRKFKVEPEQYFTTLSRLQDLLGKDKRRIKRELAVLIEMGVITVEERGKHCIVITNTNTYVKSVGEASELIPKARSTKSGKCHDSIVANTTIQKRQMPPFEDSESGKCHDSTNRKVANATIRPDPSLLEKKNGEEEILIEDEREEGTGTLSDFLDFDSTFEEKKPKDYGPAGKEFLDLAMAWLGEIKKMYPRTTVTEMDMVKVVGECRKLMIDLNMNPYEDTIAILGAVDLLGTPYLKNMIFQTPLKAIVPALGGTTPWEEACDLFKTRLKKEEYKFNKRRRGSFY